MKEIDLETRSSWFVGEKVPRFSPAKRSARTDVCVVGAGIAGLTTAYLLLKRNLRVIVLDERGVGSGETGRTSAHLASAIDDRFFETERLHGRQACRLAYESHAAAIDLIERISREENIDCDFARVDGFLSLADGDPAELLDREFASAERCGVKDVAKVRRGPLDGGPAIRFGGQAIFQPIAYLVGLANAITKMGGKIYAGRRVKDVQGADVKNKKPAVATIVGGVKISADHIVVATNTPSPINDWFGIYTKQSPYRTYMIAADVPRGAIAEALYWDSGDPYHYVRLQKGPTRSKNDLLLVGGEDHKVGQFPAGEKPFAKLESWARRRFKNLGKVQFRWSGQVQEPADGLAFIGRAVTKNHNVYVATGDSGMGLTHGSVAGLMISDLIRGRKNPWAKIYDPSRKILNAEFVRENANTIAQYKDLLTGGDVTSEKQIRKGRGAIVRNGLKKLAVYRDDTGRLHRCSALCTHLQCVVQWNPVEKTFDCPCHGSRFDAKGKVLIGPAVDDLPAA